MSVTNDISQLTQQLLPDGLAFRIISDSWKAAVQRGIEASEVRAWGDVNAILSGLLPDNDNFTLSDAQGWERALGITVSQGATLADRKLVIALRIAHPGGVLNRQSAAYLQNQLQAAGFNVFVFENRFDDGMGGLETRSPAVVSGITGMPLQLGDDQLGDSQIGDDVFEKCVNFIDISTDMGFNVGGNLRSTFFVGGNPVGTFANVPIARRDEFRALILRLKPAQTVGYLFINYV
jgi:hypothetical protein